MSIEANSPAVLCHSCGGEALAEILPFRDLCRVTSDCRGWPVGGRLGVCEKCGLVQAMIDAAWREETAKIYRTYEIYHQSGGTEQAVFPAGGIPAPRSRRLAEKLCESIGLAESGTLLDVGCGNGAFLKAFGAAAPSWKLFGAELSDQHQKEVESLPGVEQFFSGGFDQISKSFDVVSLIHVLEHIEEPHHFLGEVAARLNPGGVVFVEVPYFLDNPFDLVIADHASHFTAETLENISEMGGLFPQLLTTEWIEKELSCVLTIDRSRRLPPRKTERENLLQQTKSAVEWLGKAREKLGGPTDGRKLGIFGTSIGANWFLEECRGFDLAVDFFVDEDQSRIGRTLFGLPIYALDSIPRHSVVSVPLATSAGRIVGEKLRGLGTDIEVRSL